MEGSILSVHFEFGAGQDKYFPESSPNSPPLLKKKQNKNKKQKQKQTNPDSTWWVCRAHCRKIINEN